VNPAVLSFSMPIGRTVALQQMLVAMKLLAVSKGTGQRARVYVVDDLCADHCDSSCGKHDVMVEAIEWLKQLHPKLGFKKR
jgi:hypothetical protein